MREVFTRIDALETVNIEVDVDADELKDSSSWLFSVFVKSVKLNDASYALDEFLETKESLIIALEHQNRAKYVGSRVNDGWNELYFYAKDSKNLDSVVTHMLKDSHYKYESSVVKDAKWEFYTSQLFPSELEFHHIQSEKIIFLLEEEGDDILVPREVEHYVSFDTATQKSRFIEKVLLHGFEFKDDISSEEFDHGAALVKEHALTSDEVKKVVEELYSLLKEERGYYEGWSTTLLSDKN